MIAIERNKRVIALARTEDITECHSDSEAATLRAEGYEPLWPGSTSRPATEAEQARYASWLVEGRAH
jgi:hypothetical protein